MNLLATILASQEEPSLPPRLGLSDSSKFQAIARIACQITDRSHAAIYLRAKSHEIVLGAAGELPTEYWPRELPASNENRDIVDLPDARKVLNNLDSETGTNSAPACLTIVGLFNDNGRIGEIVVADSVKKGPLSAAQKDALLLLASFAAEQIEISTGVYFMVKNLTQILGASDPNALSGSGAFAGQKV